MSLFENLNIKEQKGAEHSSNTNNWLLLHRRTLPIYFWYQIAPETDWDFI